MAERTPDNAIGAALEQALARLRRDDPHRPVTIIVPSGPNSVFTRTALGLRLSTVRVWCDTPEGLIDGQAPLSLWASSTTEPAGWRRPTLRRLVRHLAESGALGAEAAVLVRGAWLDPLLTAIHHLEGHGVTAGHLRAVAAQTTVAADVRQRANVLAHIVAALDDARDAAGLLAPTAVAHAATVAVSQGVVGVGAAGAEAVVVVGDRALPASPHAFLVEWLRNRDVVVVRPGAASHVPPAPLGIRAAVDIAHPFLDAANVIDVETSTKPDLAALQQHLFATPKVATAAAAGVELAQTPDDVRECVECVREVRRAIARHVPLDRIAVVLPDGRQRPMLEDALRRAKIPATWLVGFPAAELMPARLLSLALEMASNDVHSGDQRVSRVYELLTHPSLSLRAALGPDAVAGRGRWRRLLGAVARADGPARIELALDAVPLPELDAEQLEREQKSRASLRKCLGALRETLGEMAQPATLGQHAARWTSFLSRFARAGESRERLLRLLQPLARFVGGPSIELDEARNELADALSREVSRGSLTERSIRVLSPLHLIGGAFDVVCALGLTEGRFPTSTRSDALVPDALIAALNAVTGIAMPTSTDHQEAERRRFAAVVGAARERLWLSTPRLDFDTERPTLPSTLVLEALAPRLGRRARFSDVEELAVRRGRRARSWPDTIEEALDAREYLVVRAAALTKSTATAQSPALVALVSHPSSRGLLQLARSIDRVSRGAALDAWTGAVSPTLLTMPGLDGAPIPVSWLAQLVSEPGEAFLMRLLRAWPSARLSAWREPFSRKAIQQRLLELATTQTLAPGSTAHAAENALVKTLLAELQTAAAMSGTSPEDLQHAQAMAMREGAEIAEHTTTWMQTAPLADTPVRVDGELPWHITQLPGRMMTIEDQRALVMLVDEIRPKKFVADNLVLGLAGLALRTANHGVEAIGAIAPPKPMKKATLHEVDDEWFSKVKDATARAAAGLWPVGASLALAGEKRVVEADGEEEAA